MNNGIGKTDEEWKKVLTPEQYRVMREKGTEPAFTGKYCDSHEKGMYRCAACGAELFSSDAKFDSGTGWPSFTQPANLKHIELKEDNKYGMARIEVVCKNCGSHLGHVFDDGPIDKRLPAGRENATASTLSVSNLKKRKSSGISNV